MPAACTCADAPASSIKATARTSGRSSDFRTGREPVASGCRAVRARAAILHPESSEIALDDGRGESGADPFSRSVVATGIEPGHWNPKNIRRPDGSGVAGVTDHSGRS